MGRKKQRMVWIGYGLMAIYMAATLWLLAAAAVQLHLLWHSARKPVAAPLPALLQPPFVSIQVPVYNEKYVVEDLLHAIAALQYPRHLFEVQVLDDSTDETSGIINDVASRLNDQGFAVKVIRRTNRHHYKAGALQAGLPLCKGEFIAILDADFRPPPNFLQALLPHFSSPDVGLVQARWSHLNREQNFLTRIQTYLLDMHFLVEQAGRFNAGYFINFCGTAGIWRKACITAAGGWDGGVLSEDLDLSYRAQLAGWRIVFDKNVAVPAQLPAVMEAFKIQQFRWTKGMAQTARKMAGRLWRSGLPLRLRLQGGFHLLGSFAFVCLFATAILLVPLLHLRHLLPAFSTLTNYTGIGALNLLALSFLYYKSTRATAESGKGFLLYYPLFTIVYLALSVQNAVAVLQGLSGKSSAFIRTPKFAAAATNSNAYLTNAFSYTTCLEALFLGYFVYGIGLSIHFNDYFFLFFFMMMTTGLSLLLYPVAAACLLQVSKRWQAAGGKKERAGSMSFHN